LRYAAIDIGSNAIRLLIADIMQNGKIVSFKKNTLIRVPVRLGDDAFLDKKIIKWFVFVSGNDGDILKSSLFTTRE
jgi:exopolyphosphatase/guanosine-5'-triphosphate,3'-diphosphate pyrophosphatase